MTHGTQDAIVRALAEPSFYPHRPQRVDHLQTHISHLFFAGSYVYKLKKAVRFSFLDFSTLERRRYFCDEELRLNRRLAAAVYLDIVPVVRSGDADSRSAATASSSSRCCACGDCRRIACCRRSSRAVPSMPR